MEVRVREAQPGNREDAEESGAGRRGTCESERALVLGGPGETGLGTGCTGRPGERGAKGGGQEGGAGRAARREELASSVASATFPFGLGTLVVTAILAAAAANRRGGG